MKLAKPSPSSEEVGGGLLFTRMLFAGERVFCFAYNLVSHQTHKPIKINFRQVGLFYTGQRPENSKTRAWTLAPFILAPTLLAGVGPWLKSRFILFKKAFFLILIFILPLGFTSCQQNHNHEAETAAGIQYTCPMHPQVVQDKPGDCPVCGMTLVAKQPTNIPVTAVSTDLNYLLQPANQTVISDIKTTRPVQKQVQKEITLNGVVTYDTRQQYSIPARFGGRIEKLYVQFNYQPVRKGQKLYDIYSPDLVTAQKELLYLLQNDPDNTELINGARQKLRLLGATDSQINTLAKSGRETYTFSVYSPYSGYVLDPSVTAAPTLPQATSTTNTSTSGMGGMGNAAANTNTMGTGNSPASSAPGNGFAIREGMYVTTGQALLKVIDASQVWAQFNLAGNLIGQLATGTPIKITFNQLPADTVVSKINLIEPIFESGGNFAQVRAILPAQNKLTLIGQLITGKTTYRTGSTLWVAKEAVLDIGTQSVAFQKVNQVFQPIPVQVGQRADGQVEVLSGLSAETTIAANAQFLVDSESFIRVNENKK